MKRWNGWGDEAIEYPLPEQAALYLKDYLGEFFPEPDVSLEEVLSSIPASRLLSQPLISDDPLIRLRHARGQSLPDWIALRSGRIGYFPDGVAFPSTEQEIKTLFDYCHQTGACLIPYGGGTSVVGHINPNQPDIPTLTIDLSRLDRFLDLDKTSLMATFESGVTGPKLERQLNRQGFTLGHFPQSFEYSTLGGWVATRSCGQQSRYYGRIEDLFAGGHFVAPTGSIDLPPFPASAAGPDLRQLFLGSEGRFGIITDVIVRIKPQPEAEEFFGVFFHDWETGVAAIKEIAQSDLNLSMLRLSDEIETQVTLVLSGNERLVSIGSKVLGALGYAQDRCILIFGVTGDQKNVGKLRSRTTGIIRKYGGLGTGKIIGNKWRKTRFLTPYLRNSIWEAGFALDTLETAISWTHVQTMIIAVKEAIENALETGEERVLVFSHLSHVYEQGASIYFTYLFRRSRDPEKILHHWKLIKNAASQAILEVGGTISHQHGVGHDHAPFIKKEKGQLGMETLENVRMSFDPDRILNPGVLFSDNPKFKDNQKLHKG
jgi:alkyldihydroxyacetonephosphate synthase